MQNDEEALNFDDELGGDLLSPPVGHGIRRNLNATNILYRVDALRRSHRTEASNLFDVAEYLQHLATDYFSYAVAVYVYAQNLAATGHAA